MKRHRAPLTAILVPYVSFADDQLVTTCFDDSGTRDEPVGVWTYEGYADWKSARAALQKDFPGVFVFSFFPGRSEYSVEDLVYCFYMPGGNPADPPALCQSGSLRVDSLDESRELTGRYSFELENGEIKALEFRALYCRYDPR